ncbi:MAG: winged helix-turn-helix transcriptional regulator [Betaproteobacteria bacterium]|nr:winged helix-turn-helix transcriptional regulator [Betaproteobacteria bacterium]
MITSIGKKRQSLKARSTTTTGLAQKVKPMPEARSLKPKAKASKGEKLDAGLAEKNRQDAALAQHDVLAKEVLGQFRSIFAAVRTHFARVEKAVGIGGAQVWALALIEASPGASLGEIAAGMDIHQSTASNLVRLLMEGGFIESLRSGDDRRKVELRITAKGRQLLRKAPKPYTGVLPHALAALPANQLKGLRTALMAVSHELNVAPALAKKPLATL